MRPLAAISLMLACSDQAGIYYDQIPEPAAVSSVRYARQTLDVELVAGQGEMALNLEAGTQSFFASVRGRRGAEYLIHELEGPDGVLVRSQATTDEAAHGLGAAAGPFFSPNRSVGDHSGATLLVPNDPRLRLSSGAWRMGVMSTDGRSHSVRVDVVAQHASARPAETRVPLHLYLTGAGGMTVQQGLEHERLARAFALLQQIYAQVNVRFSPVEVIPVDADFAQLRGVDLRSEQALALLALGADRHGINLFVIERFEDVDDLLGTVGGVSAAIPGSPSGGGAFSGVVVASSFSSAEPNDDLLGITMAHEIGHFLGLFHSEEAAGFEDALVDTPAGEGANLMHYHSRPTFTDLSSHQGMVVRGHPSMEAP